ncbi:hypothetical protein ACFL6Q_04500, partial [Candidatus Neomarinimicrobiota bacterium]
TTAGGVLPPLSSSLKQAPQKAGACPVINPANDWAESGAVGGVPQQAGRDEGAAEVTRRVILSPATAGSKDLSSPKPPFLTRTFPGLEKVS